MQGIYKFEKDLNELLNADEYIDTERKDQRNNKIVHDTHLKTKGTPVKNDKKVKRNRLRKSIILRRRFLSLGCSFKVQEHHYNYLSANLLSDPNSFL